MEKSQVEIIFENTHINHLCGWWRGYDFGSHGNVMHWAYVFFKLQVADSSTYGMKDGIGEVIHHGRLIANYKLDSDLQMPVFYNIDDNYSYAAYTQEQYLKGLELGLKEKFQTTSSVCEE